RALSTPKYLSIDNIQHITSYISTSKPSSTKFDRRKKKKSRNFFKRDDVAPRTRLEFNWNSRAYRSVVYLSSFELWQRASVFSHARAHNHHPHRSDSAP